MLISLILIRKNSECSIISAKKTDGLFSS